MTIQLGPAEDDAEVAAYREVAEGSLFFKATDDWPAREGLENLLVARVGGRVVGGVIVQPLGQFFGGRSVPTGAVRAVAVAPEHRDQGVARALMHRSLRDARARGLALATLFPAVSTPYRRVGFEHAGEWVRWELPLTEVATGAPGAPVWRVEEDPVSTLAPLYAARARTANGLLDRNAWAWGRRLHPFNTEPRQVWVTEGGYCLLEVEPEVAPRGKARLMVHELVALTPQAEASLRAFLVGHRSRVATLRLQGAPFEPFLLPLAEASATVHDHSPWMLRVVDLPRALTGRGWALGIAGSVDLVVEDALLPENAGRWRLSVSEGAAQVVPGGAGEVRVDIRALAVLYTGALDPFTLAASGGLEGSPEALGRLGTLFAGPRPWIFEMF